MGVIRVRGLRRDKSMLFALAATHVLVERDERTMLSARSDSAPGRKIVHRVFLERRLAHYRPGDIPSGNEPVGSRATMRSQHPLNQGLGQSLVVAPSLSLPNVVVAHRGDMRMRMWMRHVVQMRCKCHAGCDASLTASPSQRSCGCSVRSLFGPPCLFLRKHLVWAGSRLWSGAGSWGPGDPGLGPRLDWAASCVCLRCSVPNGQCLSAYVEMHM